MVAQFEYAIGVRQQWWLMVAQFKCAHQIIDLAKFIAFQ
jgi:hypothetical protein